MLCGGVEAVLPHHRIYSKLRSTHISGRELEFYEIVSNIHFKNLVVDFSYSASTA
jgi:hypothetical protein